MFTALKKGNSQGASGSRSQSASSAKQPFRQDPLHQRSSRGSSSSFFSKFGQRDKKFSSNISENRFIFDKRISKCSSCSSVVVSCTKGASKFKSSREDQLLLKKLGRPHPRSHYSRNCSGVQNFLSYPNHNKTFFFQGI